MRARLAERQVAAQHRDAIGREALGHGDEQRRVGIGTGAMRQHETVA